MKTTFNCYYFTPCIILSFRHNDLPWNIRKFLKNQLKDFRFGADLREIAPWSTSAWSHTDLKRLKEGMVSAQVGFFCLELQHLLCLPRIFHCTNGSTLSKANWNPLMVLSAWSKEHFVMPQDLLIWNLYELKLFEYKLKTEDGIMEGWQGGDYIKRFYLKFQPKKKVVAVQALGFFLVTFWFCSTAFL